MSEPLENLYFNWLCARVVDVRIKSPSSTYWELLKILHRTEFVWLLSGDDNRAEDGKELRRDFLIQAEIPDDIEWRLTVECSMLEMFIGLSIRAGFTTDTSISEWFWEFMENLGLREFHDGNVEPRMIQEILEVCIWRLYDENCHGGIFPMKAPPKNQKEVELWYQFCDYLVDQDRLP